MGPRGIQNTQQGDIRVRLARPDERRAVFNVFYRSVHEGAGAFYNKAQRAAWAPKSTPRSDIFDVEDTRLHWVAQHDDQIIGFMALEVDGYDHEADRWASEPVPFAGSIGGQSP